jgi:glycosyltransferase involved in cell wall biosynthesis
VSLSAALIVRDEADHLTRCLSSLVDVVDKIVVVDTGSVDDSPAVAASFGATVVRRPWDGNFAAARNLGLDHVDTDWVLYIDADEHLRPTTYDEVAAVLHTGHDHVAYRVLLQARRAFTPYREFRLWRHRPDIRFRGVIHESVTPDISRVATDEGLLIGSIDLYLHHEGYEGDLSAKHRRNLPLLLDAVQVDPDRIYLWGEIGRSYAGLGQLDEAVATWETGLARLRTLDAPRSTDSLVLVDLIAWHAENGHPDPSLVAEADRYFPDNLLVWWAGALDAAARGDHHEVVRRLDLVLDPANIVAAEQTVSFDRRIVGHWGRHARGQARFQLGDVEGALEDFAIAEHEAVETDAPEVTAYRVKRQLAEARLRR